MSDKLLELDGRRYKKVKKGEYFDKKGRKRKIHHPVRWILISCLTLFVIAPVSFVFGAFYDPTTKNDLPTATNYLDAFSNKLAEGMLELPSTQSFNVEIDEGFIDGLLGYARTMLNNTPLKDYIGNIYCYINGYNYEFVAEAKAAFFKTKVHVYTTLNSSGDTLRFKINDVNLGRLPTMPIADLILPKFLNEDTLNNMFKQAGLNGCHFSLANKEITYKKDDLRTDLTPIISNLLGSSDSSLGQIVFNLWDQLGESPVSFNNGISLKLDFSNLANSQIRLENPNVNMCTTSQRMGTYIKFAEECYKDNLVDSNNVKDLLTYCIKGYKDKYASLFTNATMQEKTNYFITNTLNLSEENYSTYQGDYDSESQDKGYRSNNIDQIESVLNGKVPDKYKNSRFKTSYTQTELANLFSEGGSLINLFGIGDKLLSDYFRYTSLVGPIIAIPIKIGDKSFLPTITITDFSTKFFNNDETNETKPCVYLDSDIDLYGLTLPLRIVAEIKSEIIKDKSTNQNHRSISFKVNTIYLGNLKIEGNAKTILLSYLSKSLPSGDSFSFEGDTFRYNISKIDFEIEIGNVAQVVNDILSAKNEDITYTIKLSDTLQFTVNYNPSLIDFNLSLNSDEDAIQISLFNNKEYKS